MLKSRLPMHQLIHVHVIIIYLQILEVECAFPIGSERSKHTCTLHMCGLLINSSGCLLILYYVCMSENGVKYKCILGGRGPVHLV